MTGVQTCALPIYLETEKRKLLSIVLLGQPELDSQLEAIPQLKTRISFQDRLRPLTREELTAYLAHRLGRAGYRTDGAALFGPPALGLLYKSSAGVPRIVNVIAHKALMLAYGKGLNQVGKREVHQAAQDTPAARRTVHIGYLAWTALVVLAVVMAASGLYFKA